MKKITFYLALLIIGQLSFAQENIIYYDDFNFDTNSGFTGFVTSNPANISQSSLIKRVTQTPTETELGYTRPANNIPRGDARALRSVQLAGNEGNTRNYEADLWLVTEAIDISALGNLTLSFASRNRFFEGPTKPTVKLMVITNYTDGTDPSTLTWTDITSTIQDSKEVFYNDGKWALSFVNLDAYTSVSGSDKFAVAFKTEYKNTGAVVTAGDVADRNRNGNWQISDFKFAENSTLSVKENFLTSGINIYPNPASSAININNNNLDLKRISMHNVLGQKVLETRFTKTLDVSNLNKGIYMISLYTDNNQKFTKKVVIQ